MSTVTVVLHFDWEKLGVPALLNDVNEAIGKVLEKYPETTGPAEVAVHLD